jgi:CheY-like chemotaxis protein
MSNYITSNPVEILLVEDNEDDILLTKEALKEGEVSHTLNIVRDGSEALLYLHRNGKYKNSTRPDIILLDLNLPRKNGYDVLAEVKNNEITKHIPIIVLTTSETEDDIIKSYKLNANCYITKPIDLHKFIEVVKAIEKFWFDVVKLPPK